MNTVPDYHMHTPLCKHAVGTPVEYARYAAATGLAEICFTDHAPAPDGFDAECRMTLDQYPEYRTAVAGAAQTPGLRVLCGIEADYYAGAADFLRDWLAAQSFDLVLGSVHYIHDWAFDDEKKAAQWDRADLAATWETYFRLVAQMADTRLYDVVGHLDLPKKFGHRISDSLLLELAQPALDRIAEADMAIELNTGGLRKPVQEIYPAPPLLARACERDIPISFGSDAHAPQQVGSGFDRAIALARRAGYTCRSSFRQRVRTLVPLPD
jgi:histidinol-phosphatase (PHP family)